MTGMFFQQGNGFDDDGGSSPLPISQQILSGQPANCPSPVESLPPAPIRFFKIAGHLILLTGANTLLTIYGEFLFLFSAAVHLIYLPGLTKG